MDISNSTLTCPPSLNTDVSGVGVRVSFYLQALLMALLSAGTESLDEIVTSLYTLVVTNLAMIATAFILGYKAVREITLQDGLVVLYLLVLSHAALYTTFPSYHRLNGNDKGLELLALVQSYLLFAYALALFIDIQSFGSSPECNKDAVISFFYPLPAIKIGRVPCLIFIGVIVVVHTLMTLNDYIPEHRRYVWWPTIPRFKAGKGAVDVERNGESAADRILGHGNCNVASPRSTIVFNLKNGDLTLKKPKSHFMTGRDIMEIIVILTIWGLIVASTELLIKWNRFRISESESAIMQFGQILPLFLILIPLVSLVKKVKRKLEQFLLDEEDNSSSGPSSRKSTAPLPPESDDSEPLVPPKHED